MKLMDDKGRLFGKLNLFDLIVILLIVVGILGICLRGDAPTKEQSETRSATYTLKVDYIQKHVADAFEIGDEIWENGTLLGVVSEKPTVTPYRSVELLPNGKEGMVEHQLYYTVLLTMETDQFRNEKGYHIDTNEMLNGTGHVISNGFVTCSSVVVNVELD